jgi:hypothetical protein
MPGKSSGAATAPSMSRNIKAPKATCFTGLCLCYALSPKKIPA